MRIQTAFASVAICAAFASLPLRAASVDELVANLRVEVEKSLAESKGAKPSGYSSSNSEIERLMSRVENALTKENFEEMNRALEQLSEAKLTAAAKEQVSLLQKEMPKAAEERLKALSAQVTATLEKAGKACIAAKTEADLDPVLVELGALRKGRSESYSSSNTELRQRLYTRVDGASRFVTRWQDALAQAARGYDAAARAIFRELADPVGTGNQYYPIVTRAEIMGRLGKETETTADDVVKGIKTLEEIPKAIAELTKQSRENRSSGMNEYSGVIAELNNISRAVALAEAGNYGQTVGAVSQWEISGMARSPETMRLKTMVILKVLPRYLELPDNPQPKAGENPSDFLLRLAGEGVTQGDWARVARILDAYRTVSFGSRMAPAWLTADSDACQQFVAAQNLENAKRYVPAIYSYQRAMKSSGKYSPHQAAAARLAALEKEQPEAFATASKEPQTRELMEMINSILKNRPNPSSGIDF